LNAGCSSNRREPSRGSFEWSSEWCFQSTARDLGEGVSLRPGELPILMDAGQPLSDLNARWWGGRATGEAFKTAFRLAQHSTWARVVEQRYSTHTASGEELRAQRVPDNYSCELRLRLSQRAHRRMWMRFLRLCSAIRRSLRGSSLCLSSLCLSSVRYRY
jgi:hypothetical protein